LDRNTFANNQKSLFARAGFFAIITLYQKLPLFRPPFSLPFHPSASPKLHKNSTTSAKNAQKPLKSRAKKQTPFRLQRAVVMFSLFVSLF
jgi:hypothetical protein